MSRQFSGFQTKRNCTAGRTGAISLVSMERALNCTELGLFSNREFSVTWPGVCKLIGTKGSVNMKKEVNTNMAAVLLSWDINMADMTSCVKTLYIFLALLLLLRFFWFFARNLEPMLREKIFTVI